MFRWTAVLALITASCTVKADFDGTSFRCSDGVCPAGFTCVDSVCHAYLDGGEPPRPDASTADAGLPDAASPDPDAAPPALCGSPGVVTEDFDGTEVGPLWDWTFDGLPATYAVTGGHGVITLAANETGNHYAGFATEYFVDLTSSAVFVEIPVMANTATTAQALFVLERGGNDRLIFLQEGGTLYAMIRVGGASTTAGEGPYDPALHRWWRIREEGGTVSFETSPDGADWAPFAAGPTPFYASAVRIQLTGGTYLAEPAPGEIHFDNLNGGGPPTATWCKTASRSDDFEDGSTGSLWARSFGTACTRAETGGQVVFTPATGSANFCGNNSGTKFDLTGSTASIEVVAPTLPVAGAVTFFKLETDNENGTFIGFAVEEQDRLNVRYGINDVWTEVNDLQYNAVTQRFWRFRQSGTTVFWEVSPNGTDWTEVGSTPNPFDLTALDVVMGAGATGATEDPGDARFDNYNRVP